MATLTAPRRSARPGRGDVAELIGHVPIFAGCSTRELRLVASIVELRELPAGATLVREGEPGREFAIVVSGAVEVRRQGKRVRVLGPGEWLGEIALLTGGPRTATATATEATRVLAIRGGMFRSLVEQTPSLAYKVLERVAALVPASSCDC